MTQEKQRRGAMLLCPPTYFEVAYEINPWMRMDDPVDHELAAHQWEALCEKLRELDVTVELVSPVPGLHDMVFAGDGGVAYRRRFVPSRFRHPERQPEARYYEQWFADRGYEIAALPEGVVFEGLGDVTLNSGYGITSYGQRTSQDAIPHVQRLFPGVQWMTSLELVDSRFFHIGIALTLLDAQTGMYVPDAFSAESRAAIDKLPHDMLAVTDEDAERMTVNAIVVGRDLIVNHCSAEIRQQLAERDFRIHPIDVSEFVKSGGATRCLVLTLEY